MVNVLLPDGIVHSLALRYDAAGKPELRFTLTQTDPSTAWTSYWPCCASGSAAERLGAELEDGMSVVITSGKLCYRKRTTQKGEQSRMEVLVWTVDRPSSPVVERSDSSVVLSRLVKSSLLLEARARRGMRQANPQSRAYLRRVGGIDGDAEPRWDALLPRVVLVRGWFRAMAVAVVASQCEQ